ncbi:mitochondrial ribosomal protein L27-domain-containing protein [Emericellopsis atlantica]|uniref:Mitochondrial ribosomal protein L27-domain-containing protein n=1 Tax=Emericellopsis atlantica TaxID=2614577 RepID=A0A9P7ZGG7_9HYPO|nr:mitochondrial ribosomal protein L27-domain-containing protein [Emericellopsis atlantica]KAG9251471.1 mitochondrial ribosomal protein L27-domain-containing protein [Emericellopsis atlantica]
MFRPTQSLLTGSGKYRHVRLTTKDVGRGFYKGNRTGSMGRHTKYGTYQIDWNKVRTYVVPDLSGCQLTPYVSAQITKPESSYKGIPNGPRDPYLYIENWKDKNQVD